MALLHINPATRLRAPSLLPPIGPAWSGAVMGTGILTTLLATETAGVGPIAALATPLVVVAWVLACLIAAGLVHLVRVQGMAALRSVPAPAWGMTSMGMLSLGAATYAVVPQAIPSLTSVAIGVDRTLWVLGTLLGLTTALTFARSLRRGTAGIPGFAQGLPVVPPMVSATTGAALIPAAPASVRVALLAVCIACFALALLLGAVVFSRAYFHHGTVAPVGLAATPSAWIPLGIVGQSCAAAQVIAARAADPWPEIDRGARVIAQTYGLLVLMVGAPLMAYAVALTIRGLRRRMPFTPGWWALTFPVGTLAMGTHLLGQSLGSPLLKACSALFLSLLGATWTLCATATWRAQRNGHILTNSRHAALPTV